MWNNGKDETVPRLEKGKAFVVSGPAGSGKTTLVDMLHDEFPHCIKNVSFTTRPKRAGEVDGEDYFFISKEEFEKKLKNNEFLEHIDLFGHKYGTSKKWIEKVLSEGKHLFLAIDTDGALSIRKTFDAKYIFIRPPSEEVLLERLRGRHSEGEEEMERRLKRASYEIEQAKYYDFEMVNDKLDQAYEVFRAIVIAELHRVGV